MTETTIHPFRGYTYDPQRIELTDVVTQPYDRFDAKMKAECLARSPYNLAHLLLPREEYAPVRETFDRWVEEQVLLQDETPALYGYEQQTQAGVRRRGFFTVVSVLPYGDRTVLPHEITLDPPRADRLRFLEETQLNAGSIFFVYNDPECQVEQVLDPLMEGPPLLEAVDYMGETHRVWRLTDPQQIARITDALAGRTLYIADGHHRYEAALVHQQQTGATEMVGAAGRLGALFNMAGDLAIWATHRMVRAETVIDQAQLLAGLEPEFKITPVEGDPVAALEGATGVRFVMALPDSLHLLETRDLAASGEKIPGDASTIWKQLDVSILQHRILTAQLGITAEQIAQHEKIDFQRGEQAAIEAVRAGTHSAAFLLLPTPLETVCTIADQGERMPQKTTDFYPKVLSGLVMRKLEQGEA